MDSSQDRSKRRKISASSGESTVHSNRKRLEIKTRYFTDLYDTNANPTEVNALCGENGQTATCARRALDLYNVENGTHYTLEKGGDSNVFVPLNVPHNLVFYVHLNFDASDPAKVRHTFFAELMGAENEPHAVTVVVNLGSSNDEVEAKSAEHNCLECTGLRHPVAAEIKFKGLKEADL